MDGAGGEHGGAAADLFSRVLHGAEQATDSSAADAVDATPSGGHSAAIGGFLVCLDVPQATEFGVDYEVFRTGPKFQGVKFLPLGVHFVLFRPREHEHGVRQGFFVNVERHAQVLVREWSAEREELGPPRPGLNVENLERAVLSFQLDSGLGPYPKQHYKAWQRLSNFITASVLQRCGVEFGAILLPGDAGDDEATAGTTEPHSGVVPYFPDLPRTVRFTTLHRTRADLSAEERTAYHFDKSARLEELLAEEFDGDWKELLGEVQLSFLVFLQMSSLAALEQWKQFTALLCSCERALESQLALFLAFVKLFRTQLEQIPADFFEDDATSDNFLRPCLLSLLELIGDDEAPPQLRQKAFRLRQLLDSRFHWDAADTELDDLAPVVVPPEELATVASSPVPALTAPSAGELRHRQQQEEDRANAAIAAAFLGGEAARR